MLPEPRGELAGRGRSADLSEQVEEASSSRLSQHIAFGLSVDHALHTSL
jgi:hypothetical protein